MYQPRHSYDDRSNYRRQDHSVQPHRFHQQKIQDQIHSCRCQCPEPVSVPDPGGILVGIEQLVELVDKIIYTQTDHDLSGQNACLSDPQFHKGLQQTQQAAGAKSCDPGDQQCKFTEVRIIFSPALGQKTIADPG